MRKSFAMVYLFATIIAVVFAACSNNDSTGPGATDGAYKTVTINHWGFDFSAGKSDTLNQSNNDGYTTFWSPAGGHWAEGIWYSTYIYPSRTKYMGKVDIRTITTVDSTAAAWDSDPAPLAKNDVVLAQCKDGFIKFQVVADIDTSSARNPFWAVQVKYLFSTKPSFTE